MRRKTSSRRGIAAGTVFAGILFWSQIPLAEPALANGADFFEEFSSSSRATDPESGAPYFGVVRDSRGNAVPQATVTATIGTSGSTYSVQTDTFGRYRIPGFNREIDPITVKIGSNKPGYREVGCDRRNLGGTNAPVEVNCVLAPSGSHS